MTKEEIANLLEEHGIMATTQRVEIAQIMLSKRQHLSADQVLAEARRSGSRVSKATIYNTLGLFANEGLIREVIVDPAKIFFDSNTVPHYHFYHVDSGVLSDIEPGNMSIEQMPKLPQGTVVDGVDVVVRIKDSDFR